MKCYIESLWDDGDYNGVIEAAEIKSKESSKARGGYVEWMELQVRITNEGGDTRLIFDNVFPREMGEVLASIGRPPESHTFEVEPDDLVNERVRARIYTKDFEGKQSNRISDYLPRPVAPSSSVDQATGEIEPDEIPF
jgi:hypothetical protein